MSSTAMTPAYAVDCGQRHAGMLHLRRRGAEAKMRDRCVSVWPWRSDRRLRQSYALGFSIGWHLAAKRPAMVAGR